MMRMLATFAALSMAGSVLLSLLPEGGIKRTAAMAIGLLTLMCWVEGSAALLGIEFEFPQANSVLAPTACSLQVAQADAQAALSARWEATP